MVDRVNQMHVAIDTWLETTAARVVNPTSANDSTNSKPYQSLLIRQHFDVPATLVTNDPDAVAAFRAEHGRIIYKSVSGERSIVTQFSDADGARLDRLATCPVQFQEHVDGLDVCVHVVGGEVFATMIASDAVDYRYDHRETRMEPTILPDPVAEACVALTARLGLELSGIDLRLASDGRVVCFAVNPSPAYIVYEDATGQPIADAIARRLVT
jgi:glutathione synthase/RimK-type ligase-like ATP-grasp enzyme